MDILNLLIDIEVDTSKLKEMLEQENVNEPFLSLEKCIQKLNKSFSGSWLGYHANVYYENFNVPPDGAFFSKEWGFNSIFNQGTVGNWHIYQPDFVKKYILDCAKLKNIDEFINNIEQIGLKIKQNQNKFISILYTFLKNNDDIYIKEILDKTKKFVVVTYPEIINFWSPRATILIRDMRALSQGIKRPPHLEIYAQIKILSSYITVCLH